MKVVIADRAAPYVDEIYSQPQDYSGGHLLMATLLFAYQIFCDFAGYSTIAIGVARLMGVELMLNFRRPYLARSIREFWQRWHISLSTWFRDYVYIPLGGNRISLWKQCRNLMLVFLVSGLWHGANWTFIVWGGLHGGALIVERLANEWSARRRAPTPFNNWAIRGLQHFSVLTFVGIAWIFFRAQDVGQAFYILTHLFGGIEISFSYAAGLVLPFSGDSRSVATALVLMAAILLLESVQWLQEYRPALIQTLLTSRAARWAMLLGLSLLVALLGQGGARSFIYFQF